MKIAIINCFDTYEHRVDLLVSYFSNNGNNVAVFSSDFKHIEKTKREEKKKHFTFIKTKTYYKNLSLARLFSHYDFSKKVFNNIDDSFDLIWILLPPNSLVDQAAKYKQKNYHTKIVFDIIDLWPETMPVGKIKNQFPFTLWKKLRNRNLNKADYIVTECDLFKTKLPDSTSSNTVSTLYLSYGDVKRSRSIEKLSKGNNTISLCYLGSMNNIIDINTIKSIVNSLSKNYQVIFHIIGSGEKKSELLTVLNIENVEVIDHGAVFDESEKNNIFDMCHFGLNIMKKEVFVGLTMKSLDYFKSGLPIINNIEGDTWDFVEKQRVGINTQDGVIYEKLLENYNVKYSHIQDFYQNHFSEKYFFEEVSRILEKLRG
ncbi:glycosyltransferase [Streptococcus hyovaginalis]